MMKPERLTPSDVSRMFPVGSIIVMCFCEAKPLLNLCKNSTYHITQVNFAHACIEAGCMCLCTRCASNAIRGEERADDAVGSIGASAYESQDNSVNVETA